MSSSRPKVYTLPNLERAPYSDLSALVARLIETADLSVVPAIFDELQNNSELTKSKQFSELLREWAIRCSRPDGRSRLAWVDAGRRLLHLFWFDLFTLPATLAAIESRLVVREDEDELYSMNAASPVAIPEYRIRAAVNISAGQWITITDVATLATNQEDPVPQTPPGWPTPGEVSTVLGGESAP